MALVAQDATAPGRDGRQFLLQRGSDRAASPAVLAVDRSRSHVEVDPWAICAPPDGIEPRRSLPRISTGEVDRWPLGSSGQRVAGG